MTAAVAVCAELHGSRDASAAICTGSLLAARCSARRPFCCWRQCCADGWPQARRILAHVRGTGALPREEGGLEGI